MVEVRFYDPSYDPSVRLKYAIIAARFNGKWIFVRNTDRTTFEIAGGHIEADEAPDDAARRELTEETGAADFLIDCVGTYSVTENDKTGFGRLYFAEVYAFGFTPDASETGEVVLRDHLPENLTYPDIQPLLFNRVIEYLKNKESI